jgi:predicted GNAT family acetyltransferase
VTDPLEPTQDQKALIDEVMGDPHALSFDFQLVNDESAGIYEAIVGETAVAGMTYNVVGNDRIVLLATSVFPEFRRQGLATEMIRRVLDDVRTRGKTIHATCPIVRSFIERNREYADLVDPNARQ